MTDRKTINITLGDKAFDVPMFRLSQHWLIVKILKGDSEDVPFQVLKIALEGEDGCGIEDASHVNFKLGEMRVAVSTILEFNGYRQETPDPNGAAPVAPGHS
jgi:hypothetical protein